MPAKHKKKKTNKKINKDIRKGILMQRDVPFRHDENGPAIYARWSEHRFSTYYSYSESEKQMIHPSTVAKIKTLEDCYSGASGFCCTNYGVDADDKDWMALTECALALVYFTGPPPESFTTTPVGGDGDGTDGVAAGAATGGGGGHGTYSHYWRYAQYRYDKLVILDELFPERFAGDGLSETCYDLLCKICDNTNEDPFFRSLAHHLVARSSPVFLEYLSLESDSYKTTETLQSERRLKTDLLNLINGVTAQCGSVSAENRKRPIQRYQRNRTVGEILDQVILSWEDEELDLIDDLAVPIEVEEEHQKLQELYCHTNLEDVFPPPPTLDGNTLRSVANLPEAAANSYLVVELEVSRYGYEQCALGFDFKQDSDDTASVVDWENETQIENGEKYVVFEFNHERYRKGKRSKVFHQVQYCLSDKNDPLPKKVLAPLVLACLYPYQMWTIEKGAEAAAAGGRKEDSEAPPTAVKKRIAAPQRPKKVLFESSEIASHPQVKVFLSMMGYQHSHDDDGNNGDFVNGGCTVGVADPKMIQLLKDTIDDVLAPSKRYFPHLYDYGKGIKCGAESCINLGICLKKCCCGKVYYCSRECQKEHWPAHKADHHETMARRRGKEEKKIKSGKKNKGKGT